MALNKRSFAEMTRDSLRYLSNSTDVTYFAQGSVAKALVEATNLEISRLQDFMSTIMDNSFLSSANGVYLDLFGGMLGMPRISGRRAGASIEDGSVRFYVDTGTLGARLPSNIFGRGLIPAGVLISTTTQNIQFEVVSDVLFPVNTKSAFVPVRARSDGTAFNVGANQLVMHNMGATDVKVTNDLSITSGADVETDTEYKFRLSKAMTTRFGANRTAIQIAANSQPGVARAEIVPYARGAGTFDVLLVPQGNILAASTKENTRRIVETVTAFGVTPTIREPVYVTFKVLLQLRFDAGLGEGSKASARLNAESAVLRYMGNIPLGGEFILNQLRSAVLVSDPNIRDMKILEFCLDGKPRTLTNIQLDKDELFVPDQEAINAIQAI